VGLDARGFCPEDFDEETTEAIGVATVIVAVALILKVRVPGLAEAHRLEPGATAKAGLAPRTSA
jgi:hypothetical protein